MSSRSSKKKTTDGEPADTVQVGRIRRPHGIRGEALVEPISDVPERFAPGSRLLVSAAGPAGAAVRRLTVVAARPHKGGLLVRFEELADRDAVEALAGARLAVPESEVPPPPPDTWYEYQLIGCRCRDVTLGDLGEVTDVVEDGGGLLLMVEDGSRRLLVPFVRAFLRRVDPEAAVIEVELPAGLVETCASRS